MLAPAVVQRKGLLQPRSRHPHSGVLHGDLDRRMRHVAVSGFRGADKERDGVAG